VVIASAQKPIEVGGEPLEERESVVERYQTKRHRGSFLAGKGRFMESQGLRIGRFKKGGNGEEEGNCGDLFDPENLGVVLKETDQRNSRGKSQVAFVNQFSDVYPEIPKHHYQ
jgi:hypothetical protein